jgi:hypothetical protein
VTLPTKLKPVPATEIFETVMVAVPELVRFMFSVEVLPTAIVPKLNEDGPTVNPGEVVSGLDAFDPVKPMQPVWNSPKTRHAAKMLKTLRLLRPAETFLLVVAFTAAAPVCLMRPSSCWQRNNHLREAATDR